MYLKGFPSAIIALNFYAQNTCLMKSGVALIGNLITMLPFKRYFFLQSDLYLCLTLCTYQLFPPGSGGGGGGGADSPPEIDRLSLPEGRTFDENIFFQGGKIEHPRTDLTFFPNKCYRCFIMNGTCHQAKAC